ncbi:MAG: hypothetical protein QM495_10920, partial [Lutibacter sp.]|uniref:hypothetical protein n=1 Tax=Lutibacter sp. TaxID=1925666 RepID=UPI00385C7E47
MKHLKMSIMLLLTVVFYTSCEKETSNFTENSEMNVQEVELQSFKSLLDMKESGIDLQSYMNSLSKQVSNSTKNLVSQRTEDSGLQFFSSAEEFPCDNLPTEDFEEGNVDGVAIFSGTLDENTDNGIFSPGDILPGVLFTVTGENSNEFALLDDNFLGNTSKVFGPNSFNNDLVINFSSNNVYFVSMDVLSNVSDQAIEIEIFGNLGSLGTTFVYSTMLGTFFGIQSEEPIKSIEFYSGIDTGSGELIDNLSFGDCDSDGDGVLNEDDPFPNSNMSESVYIDECSPDIEN